MLETGRLMLQAEAEKRRLFPSTLALEGFPVDVEAIRSAPKKLPEKAGVHAAWLGAHQLREESSELQRLAILLGARLGGYSQTVILLHEITGELLELCSSYALATASLRPPNPWIDLKADIYPVYADLDRSLCGGPVYSDLALQKLRDAEEEIIFLSRALSTEGSHERMGLIQNLLNDGEAAVIVSFGTR